PSYTSLCLLPPLSRLLTTLFFFNDTPTCDIYTLSLHDALPICRNGSGLCRECFSYGGRILGKGAAHFHLRGQDLERTLQHGKNRSEEHTSELQSLTNLVCRLLLEKKKTKGQV